MPSSPEALPLFHTFQCFLTLAHWWQVCPSSVSEAQLYWWSCKIVFNQLFNNFCKSAMKLMTGHMVSWYSCGVVGAEYKQIYHKYTQWCSYQLTPYICYPQHFPVEYTPQPPQKKKTYLVRKKIYILGSSWFISWLNFHYRYLTETFTNCSSKFWYITGENVKSKCCMFKNKKSRKSDALYSWL